VVAAAVAAEPDAGAEQIATTIRADARKAVVYYDLTFSPANSVSVYWAALPGPARRGRPGGGCGLGGDRRGDGLRRGRGRLRPAWDQWPNALTRQRQRRVSGERLPMPVVETA